MTIDFIHDHDHESKIHDDDHEKGALLMTQSLGTALVTGASSGIGAVYADRLAKRGYDLVIVARDQTRLETLATRLRSEAGVKVEVIKADLAQPAELAKVEQRLTGEDITLLVNNAGAATTGAFETQGADKLTALVQLNVVSVVRLLAAVAPGFVARGSGSVINIASVLAIAPEIGMPVYNATKAFVLSLSQSLQTELGPKGVYIQAVLPAATRTEIWERSGVDLANFAPGTVMTVDTLVDAALVGFDRREPVTIPPLHDESQWQAFETARQTMLPGFRTDKAGARYLTAAKLSTTSEVMESLS
jgi:short-subunit dehydrogenase